LDCTLQAKVATKRSVQEMLFRREQYVEAVQKTVLLIVMLKLKAQTNLKFRNHFWVSFVC